MFRFLFVASLLNVHAGLQWTLTTPADHTQLVTCSGNDIELLWNYTLSPGERIQDIKWTYQASGRAGEVIALFAAGNFLPMPAFSGRVQYMGTGAIVVQQAGRLESGNYSVEISTADAANVLQKFERTVHVEVSDYLQAKTGVLSVQQSPDAVYDNVTQQYHAQLTCAVLLDPQHPSAQVVWERPDGQKMQSSSVNNDTFHLLLPNPPSGGNYTCTLPALSQAARCLPPDSPVRPWLSVSVDEMKARVSLLEARLKAENEQLRHELQTLRNESRREVDQLKSKTASLQTKLDVATRLVGFHARISSSLTLDYGNRLQPFSRVIYNAGNAFNSATGEFTAPFAGTYYFIGSTGAFAGTTSDHHYSDMRLMRANSEVSKTYVQMNGDYHSMGSCHATLHLEAGDKVWLQTAASSYFSSTTTTFSGFLLQSDF